MTDIRIERMARLLVEYSANIQPGDKVLIESQPAAEPLIREVFKRILMAGGNPHMFISLSGFVSLTGLDDIFYEFANDKQLDFAPTFYTLAYDSFDSRIRIHAISNTKALTNVDMEKQARRNRAVEPVLKTQFNRGAAGAFKWVTTQYPTLAYAQSADMSLTEYENFLFSACHVDEEDPIAFWKSVRAEQQSKVDALAGHEKIEVHSPNCDLTLSIKGRSFINACGTSNMPDGEIFTGPVEDSVNGWVRFTYPAIYQGVEVDGVELKFVNGRVAEAKATKNLKYLESILDTDAGSRYLGEFAIGTNFGVKKFTRNILFDEKIGGTIHMAVGLGYPDTGSKNESAIHWDMICDMRAGAEILVDGSLFYKDGEFKL